MRVVFLLNSRKIEQIVGTLCVQLLSQFYTDSLETLQMLCFEDMHIVWI